MKNLVFLMAVILLLSNIAFAQDPGARDSIIADSVNCEFGNFSVALHIWACSDDSIGFYNMPLHYSFNDGHSNGQIDSVMYYWPLTTWEVAFDTIIENENLFRMIGWGQITPDSIDTSIPLITNNQRTHIMTLYVSGFVTSNYPVIIDTTYDTRNGSFLCGLNDGLHEIRPYFRRGIIHTYWVGIDDGNLPFSFSLSQNYPNPFNPSTNIGFALPKGGHISLEIYDILGQHIRRLLESDMSPGQFSVTWDGTDNSGLEVPSGTYFYKLTADDFAQTKKMLLIR